PTTSTTREASSGRVADRPRLTSWSAGRGADLDGTSAWVVRLRGRSAQTVDEVPTWSVRTEGSERGRLLVVLARRPQGLGPAIRVVSPPSPRVGLSADGIRRQTGPRRQRRSAS